LSTDDLTIGWSVPVIGVVLGTVVTLLAAYIPARLAELAPTAPHILTEETVREHLLAAALACGIKGGQQQAEKCIRNGWARGQRGAMGGAA
ncbi:hypothetical protein, partial [Streptomyces noursei]|uniref:hypothetical protein n=1 Tax=Streptomyces noursei TaxID=1971 RepID=UPI0035DCE5F9